MRSKLGGRQLPKRPVETWPSRHAPELFDTSPELDEKIALFYQSQVGILH
jgi:hypothetical protein